MSYEIVSQSQHETVIMVEGISLKVFVLTVKGEWFASFHRAGLTNMGKSTEMIGFKNPRRVLRAVGETLLRVAYRNDINELLFKGTCNKRTRVYRRMFTAHGVEVTPHTRATGSTYYKISL